MTITYGFECRTNDLKCDIEKLKSYMSKNDCKTMTIDVSSLNFIDAARVCALVSGYHYTNYIDGVLTWLVRDDAAKNQITPFILGNMLVKVKQTDIIKKVSA